MENKILLNLIEDRYRRFIDDYATVTTDFLDLAQQSAAGGFVKAHRGEGAFLYGGYEDAERRQVLFAPDYLGVSDEEGLCEYFKANPDQCPLVILNVKIGQKGAKLRHSDYLGSLLSLGIRREKTGDILVFDDGAQIIVCEEIAEYLAENYTSAGRVPITVVISPISDLKTGLIEVEHIRTSIASPRLDNVISAVFGVSRKGAVEAINRGIVFVNSVENKKPDYVLKGGEKLVLRGKGKAIYRGENGTSRKGKVYIEVDKYI